MTIAPTGTTTARPRPTVASKPSSDQILIKRIAGGDQPALRTLIVRHQQLLFRYLVRITRDPTLAKDLLNDVFFEVWLQAAKFEARSAVSTWLLGIGRLKALAALRRRTCSELNDSTTSTIVDPADNPEIALQKKNNDEVLRQCIAALSPAQGQVINLVYYHEKSVSEVAEIIGIPEATVKSRMFYARKQLAHLVMAA